MSKTTPLYIYSASEAKHLNELDAWRESFRENIACKKAIEEEIRNSFDGMHLDDSCVDQIIDRFGYKRISFVLANTLKEKSYDGRFHENNLEWSRRYFIPADKEHNYQFAVESHPAVLDGFISQYRNRLDSLNLFQSDSCIPGSRTNMEFEDRVVVVHPNSLSDSYWEPKYQLWLAHTGFGCSPNKIGRAVFATCLADGERARWNRSDFIGVIKDECIPDWAKEQVEKLRQGRQITPVEKESEPTMAM